MEDLKRTMEADPPDGPPDLRNVFPLFDPTRRPPARGSVAELAEYRRMRPMLVMLAQRAPEIMAMMREWQTVKGPNGCPVLGSILPPE